MLALDEVGKGRCVLGGGNEGRVQLRRIDGGTAKVGGNGRMGSGEADGIERGIDVWRGARSAGLQAPILCTLSRGAVGHGLAGLAGVEEHIQGRWSWDACRRGMAVRRDEEVEEEGGDEPSIMYYVPWIVYYVLWAVYYKWCRIYRKPVYNGRAGADLGAIRISP